MAIDSSNRKIENKVVKRKEKQIAPPCKVVIRKLPPSFTEEEFKEAIAPVPDHNYFSFVPADKSLGQHAYSRAYINFLNPEEIFNFKEIFDGYVFVDQKGNEFPAVVEYSPFQKTPKISSIQKKDLRCGTIDEDSDYVQFLDALTNPEAITLPQIETMLEEIENIEKEQRANNGLLKVKTPLLEYLEQRNGERLRPGDRKRRKELERKQAREEAKRKRKEIIREWRYQKREEKREERKKRDEERQKWRERRDKEDKERRLKERERKDRRGREERDKKDGEVGDVVKMADKQKFDEGPDLDDGVQVKNSSDLADENDSELKSTEQNDIKSLCEEVAKLELPKAELEFVIGNDENELKSGRGTGIAKAQEQDENIDSIEADKKKNESRDYDTTEDTPSDSQNSQKDDLHCKDPRTERRIRNKDRPAMQLYRPGQARLVSNSKKSNEEGGGSNCDSSSSSSSPVMSFNEEKKVSKTKEEPIEPVKEKSTVKAKAKEEIREEIVKEKSATKPKESYKDSYSQSHYDKKLRYRDSRKSGYYYEGERESYSKYKEDYGTYKEDYGRHKDNYSGSYKEDYGDYDRKSSRNSGPRKGYSYHHERETKGKWSSTSGKQKEEQESGSSSVKSTNFKRSTSQE